MFRSVKGTEIITKCFRTTKTYSPYCKAFPVMSIKIFGSFSVISPQICHIESETIWQFTLMVSCVRINGYHKSLEKRAASALPCSLYPHEVHAFSLTQGVRVDHARRNRSLTFAIEPLERTDLFGFLKFSHHLSLHRFASASYRRLSALSPWQNLGCSHQPHPSAERHHYLHRAGLYELLDAPSLMGSCAHPDIWHSDCRVPRFDRLGILHPPLS